MLKIKLLISTFISFFIFTGCQAVSEDKFEWSETISNPTGYPVEIYRGSLISKEGDSTSLFLGLHKGPWGSSGRSMRDGVKSVPHRLHAIWLAYAENAVYEIDTEINYEKMLRLFKESYYTPALDETNPKPWKRQFNKINVGLAPGGMVVVWLAGIGRQVEIGRYQGQKIEIPAEELAVMEVQDSLLFSADYRKSVMENEAIIPLELQQTNYTKSIPYDLWDDYRKEYKWKYKFSFPNQGKLSEISTFFYNGEAHEIFGTSYIEKYGSSLADQDKWHLKLERKMPRRIRAEWVDPLDESNTYLINVDFDEKKISDAFKTIYKNTKDNEDQVFLEINVNKLSTEPTIKLFNNKKEVIIKNSEITISS